VGSDSDRDSGAQNGFVHGLLRRAIDVRPAELRALGWSWLYIISLFIAYYILRPIRDEMGVAGGVENLQWLFTGTLVGMIAVNPAFAALVAKLPRVTFIGLSYRFFAINLLVFVVLLQMAAGDQNVWIGRLFFVWTSIFNLFVVSVFWALMVDVFDPEQSKRLFGFIAAGATIGGILGSAVTASLAKHVPATFLLFASAVLLEVAVFCVGRLSRLSSLVSAQPASPSEEAPIGGSILSGFSHALSSSYLINICVFLLLFAITSTFLYFQQAEIAKTYFANRGARTAFFASVDLWVNILTLGAQLFVTARTIKRIGVALTLALLPLLSIFGFGALAWAPTITALVVFQVIRRAGNFAFARPTREVLFTVVPREDKYKAKSFIDTVVYRLGDQVGAWSYAGLAGLGLVMTGVSLVAVPISMVWLANSLWLGRKQKSLEAVGAG